MRIAYFTESMLPLVDGVSLTLRHLFDHLESRGVEFRVYSPFTPPDDLEWAWRVHRLPSIRFPLYTDYRVSIPWGLGVDRQLDAWRPDLIHTTSPTPAARWARRYGEKRGIPVVATFHTHFPAYCRYYGLGRLEGLAWWLLRRIYARCRTVYVPSGAVAGELERHGIGPVRVWGRGVDAATFSPAWRDPELRRSVGASWDRPLLLTVSRLVREKDFLDIPPMVRRLRADGVRFRLALVGDGPLRKELEAALPEAVFAGHCDGEALSRWYASADAFVFPSTTETFGNVVQEALASGVPAVVSDRGGPRTVIRPGISGLVARANDPAHLAEQVGRLLSDPEQRGAMGRAARRQTEGHTWTLVNERLVEHYRSLVEPGRSSGARRQDVA